MAQAPIETLKAELIRCSADIPLILDSIPAVILEAILKIEKWFEVKDAA